MNLLRSFKLTTIFPVIIVLIIAFYFSFSRKVHQIKNKFNKKANSRVRLFIKPGLFYPDDNISINKNVDISTATLKIFLDKIYQTTDSSIKKLSDRPKAVLLPYGGIMETAKTAMSILKKIKKFSYDKIMIIYVAHSGDFPNISIFTGRSFNHNLGKIVCSKEIYYNEISKSTLFSYQPSFFFIESSLNCLLPIIHKVNIKTSMAFIIAGTIKDTNLFHKYLEKKLSENSLLIFLLKIPKNKQNWDTDYKQIRDINFYKIINKTMTKKNKFYSIKPETKYLAGFYIPKG